MFRLGIAELIDMAAFKGLVLTVPSEFADTVTKGSRSPEVQMSDHLAVRIRLGDIISSANLISDPATIHPGLALDLPDTIISN